MLSVDAIVDLQDAVEDAAWQQSVEASLIKEDYKGAMKTAEDKIKSAGSNGALEGAALNAKAKVMMMQGLRKDAEKTAKEALAKMRGAGAAVGEAVALHTLARIHLDTPSFAESERVPAFMEAERVAEEALVVFKAAGCAKGEGAVLNTLAKVSMAKDNADDAFNRAEQAATIFTTLEDKEGQAAALLTKASVNMALGDLDETAKLATEAMALLKNVPKASAQQREADAALLFCTASAPRQSEVEALEAAKSALALQEKVGGNKGTAEALRAVAFCQATVGNAEEAVKAVESSITFAQKTPNKHLQATTLGVGSVIYHARLTGANQSGSAPAAEWEQKALKMGDDAVNLFMDVGDKHLAALTRMEVALVYEQAGKKEEALQMVSESQKFFESTGEQAGEGVCLMTMSEMIYARGDMETAYGCAAKAQGLFKACGAKQEALDAASNAINVIGKQVQMKQQADSWGTVVDLEWKGDPTDRGVSRSMYTRIIGTQIRLPDTTQDTLFDAPIIAGLSGGNTLAAQRASQGTRVAERSAPTVAVAAVDDEGDEDAEKPRAPTGPSDATLARKKMEERLKRPMLAHKEKVAPGGYTKEAEAAPTKKGLVAGEDVLGGRAWDCPETVHEKMLQFASAASIPITKPEQRARLLKKKPTFHGSPQWRDAVKQGYIHPDLPAPKGTMWKRVSIGWKLLELEGNQ